MEILRHEPFFGQTLFSYYGELYLSDERVENSKTTRFIEHKTCPSNGLSAPTRLQIQFTNRCNLQCPHCYVSSGKPMPGEMTDDQIKALLISAVDFGILQIEWSGGEVFTRRGFLDMVKFARECGFEQNLLTNGVAIGKGVCSPKDLWKYFYAIQISIDNVGEKFNSFVGKNHWQYVSEAVEVLLKNKPKDCHLSLTTTLDKSNIGSLGDIFSFTSDKEVNWKIARQVHNGRSMLVENDSDQLLFSSWERLKLLREKPTRAKIVHPFDKEESESLWPVEWQTEPGARWFMYVGASGDSYPFPYYDGIKEFHGGNVLQYDLSTIWNSESFDRYRSVTREKTRCNGCNSVCQMWPRPFNYFKNRDLFEDPINHPNCSKLGE